MAGLCSTLSHQRRRWVSKRERWVWCALPMRLPTRPSNDRMNQIGDVRALEQTSSNIQEKLESNARTMQAQLVRQSLGKLYRLPMGPLRPPICFPPLYMYVGEFGRYPCALWGRICVGCVLDASWTADAPIMSAGLGREACLY